MFKIKNLSLTSPIIQSPMAGCTDLAYRIISRRRGLQFCFLEMISANGFMHSSHKTDELMKTIPEDKPLGAQLMGCDPEVMAAAAEKIEGLGFDLLDLNLGCPVRKVTSQGSGAALLKDKKKSETLFNRVVKAVKNIPVTIKMRIGFEDPSGQEAVDIAKIAENTGISVITVHGRTRAQGYTGKADWNAIGKVKRAVKIPVLGNGDIVTADDARQMHEISGCDGVMIGRGGLGNPWIFRQIDDLLYRNKPSTEPTMQDRLAVALEHLELEALYEGEKKAVYHMRRIGAWYIAGIPNAAYWRGQLMQSCTLRQIRDILNESLSQAAGFTPVASTLTEGQ